MKKSKQINRWLRSLAILGLLVVILLPAGGAQSYSTNELMSWTGDREHEVLPVPMQQVDPGDTHTDDNYEGTPLIVPALPEQNDPVQQPPDDNSGSAPSPLPEPSDQVAPVLETPDDNYGGISSPVPLPQKPEAPTQNTPGQDLDLEASATESTSQEILTPAASESVLFPATGDTITVQANPYWWHAGDVAVGNRTLGLSRVTGVAYDLAITDNVLNGAGHVDLDLSINGILVGSFTVLPGQTAKSVSFFFPPINGPNYVIRLEETNTVGSGLGSIVIPLDTSSLTLFDSTISPFFPASGDAVTVQNNPFWWHAGDIAVGTRTPGLSKVNALVYDLVITNNVLSGAGHVDLDLSINGIVVGSFTVLPGETAKSVSFFFPPINGPNYVIRLEETNTVGSGLGSIVIPLDTSPLMIFDSTMAGPFFPATGDAVIVQADPYWWHAGDIAVGARTPGLSKVNALVYDLAITNNVLNGAGHVDLDLSINGIVVGSFTVLPGETAKSVSFFFPPINGPDYIIRLEETNTVGPGLGSIVIPLDTSPLMIFDSTMTGPFFPATGDAVIVQADPYWWHAGDVAVGARTLSPQIYGVIYNLVITNNVLNGAGHVDLDLSINGNVVGSFTVLPGETSKSVSFFFQPINGPDYIIRLEETNTVGSGLGSIVIPLDNSTISFVSRTFLPLIIK